MIGMTFLVDVHACDSTLFSSPNWLRVVLAFGTSGLPVSDSTLFSGWEWCFKFWCMLALGVLGVAGGVDGSAMCAKNTGSSWEL